MTRRLTITEKSSSGMRREFLTRKCVTAFIISMTVFSFILFIIFWCTNLFQNAILSSLIVRNNSPAIEWFTRPPIRAVYRVHIFNYTNVDDFEEGKAKKLKIQETGPYIYRETLTRINQVFHPNGSVSFQEKRSFQWEGGSPDDEIVVVPNIPLLAAISVMRDLNFVAQLAITGILTTLQSEPFVAIPARGFLWGYDADIFDLAKPFISWQENISFDKFGVLAHKSGVSENIITIHTGSDDMSKLGMIQLVNGKNKSKQEWNDEKCDRIHGTEGYMFPPGTFDRPNASIDIYSVDMCRTLRLHKEGTGTSFGIPTLRFKLSPDVFTSSPSKDYCYCPEMSPGSQSTRQCPTAGLFNSSACNFNLPFLASFPHFFAGDKILRDKIDGLNPRAELHESCIEIHPRLGVLIGGYSRIQMNVEVRKAIGVPFLGSLDDGQILPLIWIEIGVDSIPESLVSVFKHAYFTAEATEIGMQWGSVMGIILSTCSLLHIMRKQQEERHAALTRNESEMSQNKLLQESESSNV